MSFLEQSSYLNKHTGVHTTLIIKHMSAHERLEANLNMHADKFSSFSFYSLRIEIEFIEKKLLQNRVIVDFIIK